MKRYISSATKFPWEGSGAEANVRKGRVKFNSGYSVDLGNGFSMYLVTAKDIFNAATGDIETSVSVNIRKLRDISAPDGEFLNDLEFFSYTPSELKVLYQHLRSLSFEEMIDFVKEHQRSYT